MSCRRMVRVTHRAETMLKLFRSTNRNDVEVLNQSVCRSRKHYRFLSLWDALWPRRRERYLGQRREDGAHTHTTTTKTVLPETPLLGQIFIVSWIILTLQLSLYLKLIKLNKLIRKSTLMLRSFWLIFKLTGYI